MKNLLTLCLFLASILNVLGQTSQKNLIGLDELGDYEIVIHQRNIVFNNADGMFRQFNRSLESTEEITINPLPVDTDHSDTPSTEDFIALHIEVMNLITQSHVPTSIDIFYNSDFIKIDSGKNESGKFSTRLHNFGWYLISTSSPGYFESNDTIWRLSETRRSIDMDFYLVPTTAGTNVTLDDIQFNFGKTSLTEESFAALNKVVVFLNNNPTAVFEIGGHTDSEGPADYNLLLSQWRALKVVDYFVSNGVERSQLVAHGYGETKPRNGNKTQSDKTNNRRVELTVLSNGVDLFE